MDNNLNVTQSEILISVIMITYNHDKFIRQAIEGVLNQKTRFSIELMIADDFSQDETQNIIRYYAMKYPEVIKPILRTSNLGPNPNWLDAYSKCSGKYVALCEGDDYWTDPNKLEKQVDFLEGNSEFILCYHKVSGVIIENKITYLKRECNYSFNFYDSLQNKNGNNLSLVFKKCLDANLISFFISDLYIGDWPLECLLTLQGKGFYMNECMAHYRIHEGGISRKRSSESFFQVRNLFSSRLLNSGFEVDKIFINRFIARINLKWAALLFKKRQYKNGLKKIAEFVKIYSRSISFKSFNWHYRYRLINIIFQILINLNKSIISEIYAKKFFVSNKDKF